MRWWMAAPEMPHSRAISRKGMRAFLIRYLRILRSIASNEVLGIVVGYLMTFSSLPTLVKAAMQRSSWSVVWPADTCTRMRAWPFGTTG